MKAVSFCLNGKMAHFRKYYSNSTALSHLVPPLTTIKGIIAGMLGFERDSYYEIFANSRCKIAINVKKPIKKITQTMNLLKIESLNDLTGAGKNRTQNHTEFIIPKDIRQDNVCYEIVFYHEDINIIEAVREHVCHDDIAWLSDCTSLALGSAQCPGWISDGKIIDLEEKFSQGEPLTIDSAVVIDKIEKICLADSLVATLAKEENITEFDAERMITVGAKKHILFTLNDSKLQLILKPATAYFKLGDRLITFLE